MAGQMARDGQGHFRISQRGVEYVDDSDSDNPPNRLLKYRPANADGGMERSRFS